MRLRLRLMLGLRLTPRQGWERKRLREAAGALLEGLLRSSLDLTPAGLATLGG
jgi:hypothetical protein